MTCAEIQAEAAGLASLPATDAARVEVNLHARSCPSCAAALAEGARLMDLLDEALPMTSLQARVAPAGGAGDPRRAQP